MSILTTGVEIPMASFTLKVVHGPDGLKMQRPRGV